VIIGSFAAHNYRAIAESTLFLSSANLARVYGLGGGGELAPSLTFAMSLLRQYELGGALLLSLLFIALYVRQRAFWSIILFLGLALPIAIVAFSNFKQERYAYPGFALLFVLGGSCIALLWRRLPTVAAMGVTAALLAVPFIKVGVIYEILPRFVLSHVAWAGFGPYGVPVPSTQDWGIDGILENVRRHVPDGGIALLGGSPAFHQSLFNFYDNSRGGDHNFAGYLMQVNPDMTKDDLLRFVTDQKTFSAILHKTPPYTPAFVGLFAPEVFDELARSGDYDRFDLPIVQPDGSRFTLLRSKRPLVQVLARDPLKKDSGMAAAYVFGDRYSLQNIAFEQTRAGLALVLKFHRIGAPIPGEIVFVHLIDKDGKVIAGLDREICQG
jgi:hypothetical protein